MDLPNFENAKRWTEFVRSLFSILKQKPRFVLLSAVGVVILLVSAVVYHFFKVNSLNEQANSQSETIGILETELGTLRSNASLERDQATKDRDALIAANTKIGQLEGDIRNMAPLRQLILERYPQLEFAAAVAQLSKDVEEIKTWRKAKDFRPLLPEIREEFMAALKDACSTTSPQIHITVEVINGATTTNQVASVINEALKEAGFNSKMVWPIYKDIISTRFAIGFSKNSDTILNTLRPLHDALRLYVKIPEDSKMDAEPITNFEPNRIAILLLSEPLFNEDGTIYFD